MRFHTEYWKPQYEVFANGKNYLVSREAGGNIKTLDDFIVGGPPSFSEQYGRVYDSRTDQLVDDFRLLSEDQRKFNETQLIFFVYDGVERCIVDYPLETVQRILWATDGNGDIPPGEMAKILPGYSSVHKMTNVKSVLDELCH